MRSIAGLLIVIALAVPASAQTADAIVDQGQQHGTGVTPRPSVQPVSLRAFGLISEQSFTAKTTFDGIFGSSAGPFFGGGGQVVLSNGVFAEVTVSRFSKSGERAFRSGGETFPLGIAVKSTITPVEFTGGYRFHLRGRAAIVPYVGAGVGSYSYTEKSDIADTSGDLSVRHTGYLGIGGVEVRVQRWVALDFGAAYTHVPGILGGGGLSKEAGEDDLGGASFRFRVSVGR